MAILSQTEKTKQLSLTSSLTRDTSSILLGESLMCGPHIHHDPVFFFILLLLRDKPCYCICPHSYKATISQIYDWSVATRRVG